MRVDVEDIAFATELLARINQLDITTVQLYEKNAPVTLPADLCTAWRVTGLTVADLVADRTWEHPQEFQAWTRRQERLARRSALRYNPPDSTVARTES